MKKSYIPAGFREYGSVEEITLRKGGSGRDKTGNRRRKGNKFGS